MNRVFGNVSGAKLQKANHQFCRQPPDVVAAKVKMVREARVLVSDFLGGVISGIEEKCERHFKDRINFLGIEAGSEIRINHCDEGCDQVVVERDDLVNPAKVFHLLGSESDFLFALPEYGFERRAIMGILLASRKGDLSGMGVQMGGPLGEEQTQLTIDLTQRNQDGSPLANFGVEREVQVPEARTNLLQRHRVPKRHEAERGAGVWLQNFRISLRMPSAARWQVFANAGVNRTFF